MAAEGERATERIYGPHPSGKKGASVLLAVPGQIITAEIRAAATPAEAPKKKAVAKKKPAAKKDG